MKNLYIYHKASIQETLTKLSQSGEKSLLVIDIDEKFLGVISDGDIRKGILLDKNFNRSIESIYNKQSTYLEEGNFLERDIKELFIEHNFDIIPVINSNRKIVKIYTWAKLFKSKKLVKQLKKNNIPVVIMAGGKGTRLKPFTNILPKPLIPINEKPIIEHIIDSFVGFGFSKFTLTLNYKSKIMKAYFDELKPEYDISFTRENKPMGTAGSLSLLNNKLSAPFFVTNCDIIIKANYLKIYKFHELGKYDMTLIASKKEYTIPYGTCELKKNGELLKINEKPKYNFLINTGLYVLNHNLLDIIPKNKFYHITNLIKDVKKSGMKIGVFCIEDNLWIDIGEWSEYKNAINNFKNN